MNEGVKQAERARSPESAPGFVAELQGLYGPFAFAEKLLQKIWLRGDFDRSRAVTLDGRKVAVAHPGRWNLLGGPDFKGARLRFDGVPVTGDVELHLHANDWAHHAHASDAAYNDVVLHVVLFPPAADHVTRGAGGRALPVLALLPLLHHDLEEYAAEDAVEALANRPASRILEALGPLPREKLARLIEQHAFERWKQKVHFARLRVQRLGWEEACHQTALEIFGYRFNRAPMLRIAGAHPLPTWADAACVSEAFFEEERAGWSLQGLRPANHPRRRLAQYAAWARQRPDWPARLARLADALPEIPGALATAEARAVHRFTAARQAWALEITAGVVGGTRFENLVCDGFLPLQAARAGRDLRGWWHHWFTGDFPPSILRPLRDLGVSDGRANPACHGAAQGLLGWLLERERTEAASAGRGA
jgi:hypothetical protein